MIEGARVLRVTVEGEGDYMWHGQRWRIPHSVETASSWLGSGGVFEVGEENGHIIFQK